MTSSATRWWIVAGLTAAVLAVFAQTVGFGFVEYDDRFYVLDNPHVRAGLDAGGIAWAFSTFRGGNWHPLTWISLMIDASWGGAGAGAFHATNVVLHLASTLVLFYLLASLTGEPGPSGFAALLFAIHPLHVESVAWIVERKDTLSTLFGFLAILAWTRWVRAPSTGRYAAVLGLQAASLMAKPMFVTLPLLLVCLDVWPLGRFDLRRSFREKIPLFVVSAASAAVALAAQRSAGAVARLETIPLGARAANAVVSAARYLERALWPTGLAIPYPFDRSALTLPRVALALAVLAGLAGLAWRFRATRPWIAFGAIWYAVTLAPVSGIVQVGGQAMADRYTYVPLVGPFVAVSWEAARGAAAAGTRAARVARAAAMALAFVLAGLAFVQAARWKDTKTLFTHVLRVTKNNAPAHVALASAEVRAGRYDDAISHASEACRIAPDAAEAHGSLASALARGGRDAEAVTAYARALEIEPGDSTYLAGLGTVEARLGRLDAAEEHLRAAVAAAPRDASPRKNLGVVLARRGRMADAVAQFDEAVRLDPTDEGARRNLERARAALGNAPR